METRNRLDAGGFLCYGNFKQPSMLKKFFHLITLGIFVTREVPREPDLDLSHLDMENPRHAKRFAEIINEHAKNRSKRRITY